LQLYQLLPFIKVRSLKGITPALDTTSNKQLDLTDTFGQSNQLRNHAMTIETKKATTKAQILQLQAKDEFQQRDITALFERLQSQQVDIFEHKENVDQLKHLIWAFFVMLVIEIVVITAVAVVK